MDFEYIMVSFVEDDANDKCFDDPITVLDFEQRSFVDVNQIGATIEDPGCIIEDSSDSRPETEEYTSSYGKRSLTLPVTFFDVRRNISLLKKCRPLSINIVDCGIYPWYYKKQTFINQGVVELDLSDGDDDDEENQYSHVDLIVLPDSNDSYRKSVTGTTISEPTSFDEPLNTQANFIGYQRIKHERDVPPKIIILDENSMESKPIEVNRYERLITKTYDNTNESDNLVSKECSTYLSTATCSQCDIALPTVTQDNPLDNNIVNLIDNGIKEPDSILRTVLSTNNHGTAVCHPSQKHEILPERNTINNIGPKELQVYKEIAKSIIRNVNYDEANALRRVQKAKPADHSDNLLIDPQRDKTSKEKQSYNETRENVTGSPLLPCNTTPRKNKDKKEKTPEDVTKSLLKSAKKRKPCEQVMYTANKVIPHYHTVIKLAGKANQGDVLQIPHISISDYAQTSYPELNKMINRNTYDSNYNNYPEKNKASSSTGYNYQHTDTPLNMSRPAVIDGGVTQTITSMQARGGFINKSFQSNPPTYRINKEQNTNSLLHLPFSNCQPNYSQAVPAQHNAYLKSGYPEQINSSSIFYRSAYSNKEYNLSERPASRTNVMPRFVPHHSSRYTNHTMQQVPLSSKQTSNYYFNNDPSLNQTTNYLNSCSYLPGYYFPVKALDQSNLQVPKPSNTVANPNVKITSNRINYNMDHYLWWSHIFPGLSLPSPQNKGPTDEGYYNISNNSNVGVIPGINKVTNGKTPVLKSTSGFALDKASNLQSLIKKIKDMSRVETIQPNKRVNTNSKGEINKRLQKSMKAAVEGTVESVNKQKNKKLKNNLITETQKVEQNYMRVTAEPVPLQNSTPPVMPVLSFQTTYDYFKNMQLNIQNVNEISNVNTNKKENDRKSLGNSRNRKRKAVEDCRNVAEPKKIYTTLQDNNKRMFYDSMIKVIRTAKKGDHTKAPKNRKDIGNADVQDQGYDSDSTVDLTL